MRGRFITFEGGEGTGKSTHATLLAERLKSAGIGVIPTREPGGSPGAEVIRHVLLSGVAKPLGVEAEALLFAAARGDHVVQADAIDRESIPRHAVRLIRSGVHLNRLVAGADTDLDPSDLAGRVVEFLRGRGARRCGRPW